MKNVLKMALLSSLFAGAACYAAQDMSSSPSVQQGSTMQGAAATMQGVAADIKAQLPSDWQTMTMDQKKDWLKKEVENLTPEQKAKLHAMRKKWRTMTQDEKAATIQQLKAQMPTTNK